MVIRRTIVRVLGIFLLFVLTSWYGKIDHITKEVTVYHTENFVSYSKAKKLLVDPVYISRTYFYKDMLVETYSRTLIPFKYKKERAYKTKQYYSRH